MRVLTSFLLLSSCVAAAPCAVRAQALPANPPAPAAQTAPDTNAPEPADTSSGKSRVLFSRSEGQAPTARTDDPQIPRALTDAVITDAMRAAPVYTSYNLQVHLVPAQAALSVQARLELRNGGADPLRFLPLQLSSTLHVDRIALSGARLPFVQRSLASDADHTGQLNESVVALPQALAPGTSLSLIVEYSGSVEPTSARLDRLQTPAQIATSSDWDTISEDFTGLRGFGDVVWYPVSSVPAQLGDGDRLFAEVGRQRARNQEATIAIHVTDEFAGSAPNIVVLAGHALDPGAPAVMPSASFPGVLRFDLPATRLGFRAPSLFAAVRAADSVHSADPSAVASPGPATIRIYSTPAHAADAQGYQTAATLVEPLLTEWLGNRTRQPLTIIDLPVEGAQPGEQGDALLLSLTAADPAQLAPLLSQEVARTCFHSPRVWLTEGVAALMGNLYTERTRGHDTALERLASPRGALALAEPASPGSGAGQDLLHASDAIYYRAKALYVLWMLRDLAGDKPLQAALSAYDASADTQPAYFQKLVEQASGKDLKWFFDAWVYQDRGLPDLSIVNVYPSHSPQSDQWLVSIDIANEGYADAEVPVTLHAGETAVTERVRIAGRTKVSRRMLIGAEPTSVDVNDGSVPEVQASVHQRLLRGN